MTDAGVILFQTLLSVPEHPGYLLTVVTKPHFAESQASLVLLIGSAWLFNPKGEARVGATVLEPSPEFSLSLSVFVTQTRGLPSAVVYPAPVVSNMPFMVTWSL